MSGDLDNERFRKLLFLLPVKAIGFLYHYYYHPLVRIAESLTHDRKASEDIVQETFVHVWESHRALGMHRDTPIQHYLVRVVTNKAKSQYKRTIRRREWRFSFLGSWVHPTEQEAEIEIIRTETSHEIRRVIETFPRREKECLLMKIDEEMTVEQMAERMNVTRKAVERSMTSANKRLRQYWSSRK